MMDTTPSSSNQNASYEAASSYGRVKVENNDDKERKLKGKLNIRVTINKKSYICQTDGKESVLNMIMKKITKKDQQILVFQSVLNRSCLINLGLPTGVLDESVTYECRMHGRKQGDETLMRKFDVAIFDDSWDIKYFYVKISEKGRKLPAVSSMAQFADILQVPFFNGEETYFEALVRDRRFDKIKDDGNLKIGSCHFEYEKKSSDVELTDDASPSEICFEFHRRKGTTLISGDVKPLTCPSALLEQRGELVIKKEPPETPPGKLDQHQASLTQESSGRTNATSVGTTAESGVAQGAAEHNVSEQVPDQSFLVQGSKSAEKLVLPTLEEFKDLVQSHFEINVKETISVKVKEAQIEKVFTKAKYDNFALTHNHELSVSDLEKSLQLCYSTGAVVEKLVNGEVVKGTCFRVGPKYVITNLHVYNNIDNASQFTEGIYVDFGYTIKNGISPSSFTIGNIVTYSEELDYIIFEVEKHGDMELPKSVTSFFKIPLLVKRAQEGEILTLCGHPDGSKETVTNLMCPVKNPTSLHESVVIGLSRSFEDCRHLSDQRRQSYDVSTFFYGSSGSPGVLLRYDVLLVLHTRGFFLGDKKRSVIEQGVLMPAIVADVTNRLGIEKASELFDLVEKMEVDETDSSE